MISYFRSYRPKSPANLQMKALYLKHQQQLLKANAVQL